MQGILTAQWWTGHWGKPEGIAVIVSVTAVLILSLAGIVLVLRARAALREERASVGDDLPRFTSREDASDYLKTRRLSVSTRAFKRALETGAVNADVAELEARIHWSVQFAGLLVFIGLFGTVAAMFTALANLSQVFHASGSGEATTGIENAVRDAIPVIRALLDGLFLASLATLSGLVGTIVLGLINARYLQGCEALRIDIERIAADVFVPLHAVDGEDSARNDIRQLAAAMAKTQSAAERLTKQVAASERALAEMVSQSAVIATAMEEAGATIHAEILRASMAREGAEEQMEKVTDDLHQTVQLMRLVNEKVKSAADVLDGAVSRLDLEHAGLEEASNTVADSARAMEREVRQLREDLASSLKDQTDRMSRMVEGIRAVPERLLTLLNEFDRVLTDVVSVSDPAHLRDAVAQASGETKKIVREIEAAAASVAAAASDLREQSSLQATYAAQLTRQTAGLDEALDKTRTEVTRVCDDLRRTQVAPRREEVPPPTPVRDRSDGHRPWTTRVRDAFGALVRRPRKR